jgi:hypothetical protein
VILGVHLQTWHFAGDDHNRETYGAYARMDGWTLGAYKNSRFKHSAYLGYTWEWGATGLTAARVTGYTHTKWLLVPSYSPYKNVRLSFVPPWKEAKGGIHLSIEREFK